MDRVKDVFIVAMRGRNTEEDGDWIQRLEQRTDGLTNSITTVTKDNLVLETWSEDD